MKKALFVIPIYYLLSFIFYLFSSVSHKFSLTVLNVSQGDSILIRTRNGHAVLVDGGGNGEASVVLRTDWPFKSCVLDQIILTHPHADHAEGFERILPVCKIRVATFNDVSYTSKTFDRFKSLLKKNNVKIDNDIRNFEIDGVRFVFLWPQKPVQKNLHFSNINDSSVVVFVDYGSFEALLLGDLESVSQERLKLSEIEPYIDEKLDVLKISHHGANSGYNPGLVSRLDPLNCVISVGKGNTFGHPHSGVLDYLKKDGCTVFRTDISGAIEFIR